MNLATKRCNHRGRTRQANWNNGRSRFNPINKIKQRLSSEGFSNRAELHCLFWHTVRSGSPHFCFSQVEEGLEREYNDSLGFWIPHCGFRIPGSGFQSLLVEFGFSIPIVNGILDSNFQDFGFYKQTFSGIRIPLHGATQAGAKYYFEEILCITG